MERVTEIEGYKDLDSETKMDARGLEKNRERGPVCIFGLALPLPPPHPRRLERLWGGEEGVKEPWRDVPWAQAAQRSGGSLVMLLGYTIIIIFSSGYLCNNSFYSSSS